MHDIDRTQLETDFESDFEGDFEGDLEADYEDRFRGRLRSRSTRAITRPISRAISRARTMNPSSSNGWAKPGRYSTRPRRWSSPPSSWRSTTNRSSISFSAPDPQGRARARRLRSVPPKARRSAGFSRARFDRSCRMPRTGSAPSSAGRSGRRSAAACYRSPAMRWAWKPKRRIRRASSTKAPGSSCGSPRTPSGTRSRRAPTPSRWLPRKPPSHQAANALAPGIAASRLLRMGPCRGGERGRWHASRQHHRDLRRLGQCHRDRHLRKIDVGA